MRIGRGTYMWGTVISLSLFLLIDWWLLKMLLLLTAGILAISYASNEDEQ